MKVYLKKIFQFFMLISSITGLVIMFYINLKDSENLFATTLFLLSYFTILSNIFVVILSLLYLLGKKSLIDRFSIIKLGALVNISITGIAYFLLLRNSGINDGLTIFAGRLLHYVTPVLFILYILIFETNKKLEYKKAFQWLLCPFLYLGLTVILAPILGTYPYPFLDVNEVGLIGLLVVILFLVGLFLITGVFFVFMNNLILTGKKSAT